jgi:hypothetical protein
MLQTNSPQVSVPAENAICAVCAIWAVTFVEDKDLGRVCPACADRCRHDAADHVASEAMTVSGLGIEAFKSNSCEGCH